MRHHATPARRPRASTHHAIGAAPEPFAGRTSKRFSLVCAISVGAPLGRFARKAIDRRGPSFLYPTGSKPKSRANPAEPE